MIMGYDARDAGESMSGASGRGLTAARSSVTAKLDFLAAQLRAATG